MCGESHRPRISTYKSHQSLVRAAIESLNAGLVLDRALLIKRVRERGCKRHDHDVSDDALMMSWPGTMTYMRVENPEATRLANG